MAHGRGCRELVAPRNRSPYLKGGFGGKGRVCFVPLRSHRVLRDTGTVRGRDAGGGLGAAAGRGAAALPAGGHGSVRLGTARYGSVRTGPARYSPARSPPWVPQPRAAGADPAQDAPRGALGVRRNKCSQ